VTSELFSRFSIGGKSESCSTCAIYDPRIVLFPVNFSLCLIRIPSCFIFIHIDLRYSMIRFDFTYLIINLILGNCIFIPGRHFFNMIIVISIMWIFPLRFAVLVNFMDNARVSVLNRSDNFIHLV